MVKTFKLMIQSNMVKNCPVTVENVTIAEKIFGPALSSLKGKSTRQKPKPNVFTVGGPTLWYNARAVLALSYCLSV